MIRFSRSTRTLITIMSVLVLTAILLSYFYYRNINSSVDPRIVEARNLYEQYNSLTGGSSMDAVFRLLDSIEPIYSSIPHYSESFEVGVLSNNRGAAWLTEALFADSPGNSVKDSLLNLADLAIRRSISIYEAWEERFAKHTEEMIKEEIRTEFMTGLERYAEAERKEYLEKRVEEIIESQTEIHRRLSVSYTNLGIIYRHREEYEAAVKSYQTALELWDRNLTAENNLNILLGQPLKKRNILQRLFPPERL